MSVAKKKSEPAKLGVFMPCYNLGKHIQEALDSLFNQTFQDFELIIADDASTDKTTKRTLQNLSLPRGKIFFEEKNMGLNAIRNKYFAQFNTQYIMSFDPDDLLEPRFLEKSIAYLDRNPTKGAVAVWLKLFGTRQGIVRFDEKRARFPEMLITNNYLGSCVMRKQVFDEVGGYDNSKEVDGAEDYDFWLSALEHGWELGVIPEVLFHYRRAKDSLSARSSLPEMSLVWRKKIIARHHATYQKYLNDVLLGFEERASGSHAGYIETVEKYDHLHEYVEQDLLPKIEDLNQKLAEQHEYIEKIKKTSLRYYSDNLKNEVRKILSKQR